VLADYSTGEAVEDPLGLLFADERSRLGRPWVLLNFVASVDGAIEIDGKSSGLGDADDSALFKAMRAVADVVLVGAGTVRAENYHPVTLDPQRRDRRLEAGLDETPRLVIVSGRMHLSPEARVFSDPRHRPTVLTSSQANQERVDAVKAVADVHRIESLGAEAIIDHLHDSKVVLCEGGPSLAGQLVAAGLVDEFNLTVAPVLTGGDARRVTSGIPAEPPIEMRLDRVLGGDKSLFLRYLRSDLQKR
jgi:riboflavin biosynthesis pyrimidine reductase